MLVSVLCGLGFVQIVLAAPPAADFTFAPSSPISGQAITFTSQATDDDGDIVTTEWDFDYDGTFEADTTDLPTDSTATHTYSTSGPKRIAMRVTDGIVGDAEVNEAISDKTVTVSAPNVAPTASLTVSPNPAAIGATVTFGGSNSADTDGSIVNYEWDLDGNGTYETDTGATATVSRTYPTDGTRTIRLRVTDDDGAVGTDTQQLRINVVPTASFTISPNPAQINERVDFDATGSGDSDGTIVKYEWDLDGNGGYETDTGATPTTNRTYTTSGTRTIRLRVTDNDGAVATDQGQLEVNARPTASFTISPNPAQINERVDFDATGSGDSDGTIVKYEWDLDGNGGYETDTGATPTTNRTYTTSGTRTIRLRVTDNDGAQALDADTLVIANRPPAVAFTATPNPAQVNQSVDFESTSTDPDGKPLTHDWDLDGNGSYETPTGTTRSTSRSYDSAAVRLIGLRVTDPDGGTATATVSLRINAKASPSFTINPNPALIGETVTFDAGTSVDPDDPDRAGLRYEWDLDGNGSFERPISGNPTTTAVYSDPDTSISVTLRVTDEDGATSTLSRDLRVQETRPIAAFAFAPQAPLPGQAISLTSQSSPSDSPGDPQILSTEWDFNYDPTKDFSADASGTSTTTSYPTAGTKAVAIKVTETGGGFAIATAPVVVNAPPQASFGIAPVTPLEDDTVTFSSTSGDPDGPLGAQEWDLDGDGQFDDASGAVVSRAYRPGSFTIRLRVTDARGATATAERRIDVLKRPPKLLTGVKVTLFGDLTRKGVRLKGLLVRTPAKATAKVTCKGRKCPKGIKAASKRTSKTKRLRFKSFERSFPAGTLITVTVTRPGYIGQYTTIKVRKGLRRYIRRDRCLAPGSRTPIACPDS